MVGAYTHGHVGLLFLTVFQSGDVLYLFYYRLEHVSVVVRVLALQRAHETLEAHTGIDDVHWQRFERAVGLAVELHEDDVPDLDNLRVVLVHELASRHFGLLLRRTRVEVYLRARTARTRIAHLPEVVVLVSVYNVVGRHVLCPETCSLLVACYAFLRRAFEHCHVKIFGRKMQHINEIFPRIVYGSLLEIIAEAPVAEHLEHCVMVCVVSHFFKVVVLATHAKTLLRVGTAARFRVARSENDVLPLVHSGIGKHQRWVIFYHHRC